MNEISDPESLRAHMGPVSELAARKVMRRLDRHGRHFISLSPFLVIASADGEGRLDVSPRGDPPGFVQVLDDLTLFLPDRPGNNRVDTMGNLMANPAVALIFFVPGVEETFRVNGTARVVTDAGLLAGAAVLGRTPRTGVVVTMQEGFFHCAKALKRSRLWDGAAQIERSAFPSLGRVLADQQRCGTEEELEERVQAGYRERMY